MCRCQGMSESAIMIWRRERSVPRRSASHFMKQFTTRQTLSRFEITMGRTDVEPLSLGYGTTMHVRVGVMAAQRNHV